MSKQETSDMVAMADMQNSSVRTHKEFAPFQPYLETNLKYRTMMPDENTLLKDVVWEIYQVDGFDTGRSLALPDLSADIMTFYTKDNAYSYFCGASINMQEMQSLPFFDDITAIFGVRMRTGMLGNLFRCDVKDIGNSRIDMCEALWNGSEIEEQMAEAGSFTERWQVISDYLLNRVRIGYHTNNIAIHVIREVIRSQGSVTIKELEQSTGYTGRYLRQVVEETLGVSIKQLCEVTKFQWMCNHYIRSNGEISLSALACQSGFYDQSHMNRCCKQLTGTLPRTILGICTGNS